MQTITVTLPAAPLVGPSVPAAPSPARPGTLHAGSRGIWKDTRTKPLAA